jgi:gas vesicle protein
VTSLVRAVGLHLSAVALVCISVGGCAQTKQVMNKIQDKTFGGFNSLEGKYGGSNAEDSCQELRQPLIDTGKVFSQSMVTGALLGAAAGAGVGAAVNKNNRGMGAFLGGLTGGAAGAFAGYLDAKRKQANTQAELLASIDADAARDNKTLVSTSNVIKRLTSCRRGQIASVEKRYKAKKLTAAQAKAELERIQAAVHEDNQLIAEVLGDASERSRVYVDARADASKISDTQPSPTPVPRPKKTQTENKPPEDKPPTKPTPAASGGGGTEQFAESNDKAQKLKVAHDKVENDLQTRISDLSAIVG